MACFGDNTAVEFLEGALPRDETRRVEAHAARCDGCRRFLAELARAHSENGDELGSTVPAGGQAHRSLARGQEVGRFMVLSRLGSGGMGVVFSAYDPKLDRKVALKLLHSSDGSSHDPRQAQARLLREAQAIAQLSHPNVISVYDVGTFESEVYVAMELVEGDTLGRWLAKWDRPVADVLDKFRQAGRALAAAHARGLLHRDFKPDNVLVGHDERVRVMDFGLARSLFTEAPGGEIEPRAGGAPGAAWDHPLTRTGMLLGTPRYMAPEQLAGKPADARSDQFSFCVALYEAVCGRHPFERGLALDLVERPTDPALQPPPARARVPEWLQRVLRRGLEADPSRRYPSMQTLLAALTPPRVQRRTWAPAVFGLAAAGVLAGAVMMGAPDERPAAGPSLSVTDPDTLERLRDAHDTIAELEHSLAGLRAELDRVREHDRMRIRELLTRIEAKEERVQDLLRETRRLRATLDERPRPDRQAPGGLDADRIDALVSGRIADVQDCFREWRERMPREDGQVTIRVIVGPSGAVWSTEPRGVGDRVLKLCVSGLVRGLDYPESDAWTTLETGFAITGDELVTRVDVLEVEPAEE